MRVGRLLGAMAVAASSVTLFAAAGWQTAGAGSGAAVTAATLAAQSPTLVSAPGAVTLTWSAVAPTPASWNVLRSARADGPWTTLASLPGGTTTYSDSTATGAAYYEVQPVLDRWIGTSLASQTSQPPAAPEARVAITDDFTPRGGDPALGAASGWALNGDLTWHTPGSSTTDWSRTASGEAAVSSDATDAIATVDAGTPDVSVTEHVAAPGDAAYVRVQDANDWLRARVDAVKKHVSGGYESYVTQYQWKQPDEVFDTYRQDVYRWTVQVLVYRICNVRNTNDCIYTTNMKGDSTHTLILSKVWTISGNYGTTPEYAYSIDENCDMPPTINPPMTDCVLFSSSTSQVLHGIQPANANDHFVGTTTVPGATYWWTDPNSGAAPGDTATGATQQVARGWVDTSYDEEDYALVVDRDSGGTITTLATYDLGTTAPGSLRLTVSGTQVSVAAGGSTAGTLQVDGLPDDDHCGVGLAPTTDATAAGSPRLVGAVTIAPAP